MKKVFFILSLVMLVLASCDKNKSANTAVSDKDAILVQSAQQAQNLCPMEVDYVTTLTGVNYNPNTRRFTYEYEIDESQVEMSVLSQSAEVLGQSIVASLENNELSKLILNPLAEVNGLMYYVYKGSKSGDSFTIVVNPKDNSYEILN